MLAGRDALDRGPRYRERDQPREPCENLRGFHPGAARYRPWALGSGLYLVHRLVVALDGKLKVASEPGVGATFTLSLPAAIVSAEGRAASAAGAGRGGAIS